MNLHRPLARATSAGASLLLLLGAGTYFLVDFAGAGDAEASTPEQQAMLADGVVTMSEVESAVETTRLCAVDEGLSVDVLPGEGLRPPVLRVFAGDADGVPDRETARAAHALMANCRLQHSEAVMSAWYDQYRPTAAELEGLIERLEACVAAGGSPAHASFRFGTFVHYRNAPRDVNVAPADLEAYQQCAWKLQGQTGVIAPNPPFPPFGGQR